MKFARIEHGSVVETLTADTLPEFHPDIAAQWLQVANYVEQGYVADGLGGLIAPTPPDPLPGAKAAKIAELKAAAEAQITGGFVSNALGSDHRYSSGAEDQINLIGATLAAQATGTIAYACTEVATDSHAYRTHTAIQIATVLAHGAAFKGAAMQRAATLVASVEAATTVAGVEAIAW